MKVPGPYLIFSDMTLLGVWLYFIKTRREWSLDSPVNLCWHRYGLGHSFSSCLAGVEHLLSRSFPFFYFAIFLVLWLKRVDSWVCLFVCLFASLMARVASFFSFRSGIYGQKKKTWGTHYYVVLWIPKSADQLFFFFFLYFLESLIFVLNVMPRVFSGT